MIYSARSRDTSFIWLKSHSKQILIKMLIFSGGDENE